VTDQTAPALAAHGLYLFPVDHPELPVCVGRHAPDRPCDGTRGKHPEPWSWSRSSTRDPERLARVFRAERGPRNVGIDCGRSGLVVLDEDTPGGMDRACREHGEPPPHTLTVATPRPGGGRHFYFRQPEGLPFTNSPGRLADYGIDVRGRGGFVIAAGSLHHTGRVYQLAVRAPIAPVPEWIAALLRPPAPARRAPLDPAFAGSKQALIGLLQVVLNAPVGQRNTSLNWAAWRMWQKVRAGQVSESAAVGMLLDAAAAVGLGEGEARATIGSARRAVLGA
jgi:Bifunctional DNA primase/polymerase, N-terminal